LIADTPIDFVNAIKKTMQDKELRKNLIQNGKELARERYDWEMIAPMLEKAWHDTIDCMERK
jgi:glycosyltransferase involved in cell wall biosynthesis